MSSNSLIYAVDRAVPSLSLSFSPGSSVSSGTTTNVTGYGCPIELNGSCKLYRDGIEVNNSDILTLGAGTYSYEFNTTGNENYTNANVSGSLIVKSSGGSGGGGNSGYQYKACYSNWTCTDWSVCENGKQIRFCDLIDSACLVADDKPFEVQNCVLGGMNNSENIEPAREIINPEPEPASSESSGITGGVIGALSKGNLAAIGVFGMLICAAYGYSVIRKRRFQNSLERTLANAK